MKTSFFALAALGLTLTACPGRDPMHPQTFSTDWLDDQGKSIAAVQTRLKGAPAGATADLVVAVAGEKNDKLIGAPLSGGARWTFQHALDARPMIIGSIVLGSGQGEIFALDATNGRRLWARPTGGLALLGGGDDGTVTAVTLSRGTRARSPFGPPSSSSYWKTNFRMTSTQSSRRKTPVMIDETW